MRDFFKYVFASCLGFLLFSTASLGGLIFLIIAIASGSREAGPTVEQDSVLVFDLSLDITDANPESDPGALLSDALSGNSPPPSVSLHTVLNALEEAANDDRIVGLLLRGNISDISQGSGPATLKEVRDALLAFQASGKPILAYEVDWSEPEYYLASVADTLYINPSGIVEINGFRSETMFYAGALDKYGIDVQVIRAGSYKSAVEPFIRSNNSPENREQLQALLNDLWDEFKEASATSRGLKPEDIQSVANTSGLLLPQEAVDTGLFDRIAYGDEVLADLRSLTGETDSNDDPTSFRQVSLPTYAETVQPETAFGSANNRIVVLYAEGEITSGEGGIGVVGSDRLIQELRELRQDETVKAIVLRINSPGGGATPSEMIAHEVKLTRDVKPVIVSMGSVAASGGYMIASYGNQIFASPNTITGSIGVFGLIANVKELANKNGLTWDVVKTAPFADSSTIARPLTPQELAIGQRMVDETYNNFLDIVADSRPLSREQVAAVAQGHVWSGEDALEIGLVDKLGGLDAAIQAAVEAAGLQDQEWQLDESPRPRTLEEQLLENLFSTSVATWMPNHSTDTDPISTELQQVQQDLERFSNLNDPRGVYTLLPFTPRVE
jgi:protease-4